MIIQEKIGNINVYPVNNKKIDWLTLQWYETRKRIMRKHTSSGIDISIKFLHENPALKEGDILFESANSIVAVTIAPCNCIVISPANMLEMAALCYEIGNKHLPLFFENECLLVPFDAPLLQLIQAQGYAVKLEERKLLYPLNTTVAPHGISSNSLFSKIMKLSNQTT